MPTYTSQYPPAHSDTYVKATTTYDSVEYETYFATDPALSLIGSQGGKQWLSLVSGGNNQRFHIDLGSAKIIRRIYYENSHSTGINTPSGVNNFTFWGSNIGAGSFDDLVWGNDGGWTILTVAQNTFDEHDTGDNPDPNYIIVTNSTEYRYYAFKFVDNHSTPVIYMAIRRIDLQTEDGYTPLIEANAIFFGTNF